jgi:hypothetical protein
MIKTLAVKELREVLGIAALGLGLGLVIVGALAGVRPLDDWLGRPRAEQPFHPQTLQGYLVAGVLFALLLGLRQSLGDQVRGTYAFLLHRPVRRATVILTKLATGVAVLGVGTGLPLALYAVWAATPGNVAAPFAWWMTGYAGRVWFLLPLMYLGAFLSGLRPGRWYGTRLLPLAAAGLVGLLLLQDVAWWWIGFPAALAMDGLLVVGICYVGGTRDY